MTEPRGGGYQRFECPECGRSVASLYRDAIHVSLGPSRFLYAYLRRHRRPGGAPCPASSTGPLAAVLPKRAS